MMSGSELMRRDGQSMTGMFSNSSEQNNSHMMQSGLSYQRARLLKDAATGTYNTANDTLRSLTTEQKTVSRNRVQDVIQGAYKDQQLLSEQ